jgi:hypothetical protein
LNADLRIEKIEEDSETRGDRSGKSSLSSTSGLHRRSPKKIVF